METSSGSRSILTAKIALEEDELALSAMETRSWQHASPHLRELEEDELALSAMETGKFGKPRLAVHGKEEDELALSAMETPYALARPDTDREGRKTNSR